jgi:exodeoxyribonuclease VII large subunit
VHVQGDQAAFDIERAFDYFNESNTVDTIIISRGGGSLEELWAFNTLPVAEAIYHSKIPVISGVGHETDFTISDFVADKRAATPSEAAELSTLSVDSLTDELMYKFDRLNRSMILKINQHKLSLENQNIEYLCQLIKGRLETEVTNIDSGFDMLHNSIVSTLDRQETELKIQGKSLNDLSPLMTLDRGYSIALSKEKKVSSIDDVKAHDSIDIIVKNGIIKTEVISKERKLFDGK